MSAKPTCDTKPFTLKKQGSLVNVSDLITIRASDVKQLWFDISAMCDTAKTSIMVVTNIRGKARNYIPGRDTLEGEPGRLNTMLLLIDRIKKLTRSISSTEGHEAMENLLPCLVIKPHTAIDTAYVIRKASNFQPGNVRL